MSARAGRGLGRTFQRIELFDSMTVAQNVGLGHEAFLSARRPWSQLASSRQCRRLIADSADDAIRRCGLGPLCRFVWVTSQPASADWWNWLEPWQRPSGTSSSTNLHRASTYRETEHFGQIIVDLVSESGIGILLVEHDMALIAKVCSYVYVLDFGQLIYEGSTSEVLSSDVVRAAYLGSSAITPAADNVEVPPLA